MSARNDTPKVAVVTGGASGIGKAIAERLATDGHRIAVFDVNPGQNSSERSGETTHSYAVDVTDRAGIDAALARVHDDLGPVGILVNAAGLDGFTPFLNITFEDWQKVVNVNLHGVFHMVQAVLPEMIEAGWGRIVNISSSSTHSGTPYMSHYVSAKSGVNGLTKSLALEYGPTGVTVNAVPPGFIDTPMLRKAADNGFLGDLDKVIEATPVRRMGKPEDIAAAVAFLASEEAGYITGQILGVNGGRNT
jgi:NAD(P)-dependent dehydrogenase (short-subunit alcohol dehydrogenase family)